MAFTNLYIQSGGADANAGTSTANAADVTQTNGSWDITADTFIATAATPFSAVTTNDWASIYVDGGTVAVYVAQVVSINAGGLSVTLSTTAKYGTKPSASATGRSCKINGAWATEQPLAAGGLATTTVPASTKVNIKAATYTITASRVISMAGTTTKPLWFSGYNTTPGDLDADTTNGLTKPLWALNSTFTLTTSGVFQTWSGISVTAAVSSFAWHVSGANISLQRCRVENTSSNAGAYAVALNANGTSMHYCWCKVPTTTTSNGCVEVLQGAITCIGTVADTGGKAGFSVGAISAAVFDRCIAINNTGSGILFSTGGAHISNCTFYNPTVAGVKWTGTPLVSNLNSIVGCLFSNCGTYGIDNASGTNCASIRRMCNDFYSCTSGNENGFGDYPSFFGQTDGSAVVTSSTDMTPVTGSAARNNGFPGKYENQSYINYQDVGAVDHIDPSGGGGYAAVVFGG